MSRPLPEEILDAVMDHLHDESRTLKSCCIVCKAWIHPTRRRLYNHVTFRLGCDIGKWKQSFPDPKNSPAHNTRTLSVYFQKLLVASDRDTLLTFHGVSRLNVDTDFWHGQRLVSLVPLRGFSPAIRSLHLSFARLTRSEIFGLICSFPLLEDLSLVCSTVQKHWVRGASSTSPRLTGFLELRLEGGIQSLVSQLLDLPSGLHFKRIAVQWLVQEDVVSTVDLLSRCSHTLEFLEITNCLAGMLSLYHVVSDR